MSIFRRSDDQDTDTPPAPATSGAGSTLPPASAGPTPPSAVPDAGLPVAGTTAPCTRFEGAIIEITAIANSVPVTVAGTLVAAPYWQQPGSVYEDGLNSTHPAAVPTESGSDLEMTVKIEVTKAEGLAGEGALVGTLSDGVVIQLKGSVPMTVGVHSVTVKLDSKTTRLARHRGTISWEVDAPGCGKKIIGRTRVEIYRIIKNLSVPFLAAGRPAEALRLAYEAMSVTGLDVATAIPSRDIDVTARITSYLHSGHGLTYDVNGGRSFYLNGSRTTLFLLDYITRARLNVVNCYDQASGVWAFAAIMGADGFKRFVGSQRSTPNGIFGFINTTTLVGGVSSNNPFYGMNGSDPIVRRDSRLRTIFGNHQFFMHRASGVVFDACAGPHLGTEDYLTYMNASVDLTVIAGRFTSPERWRAAWTIDDHHSEFTSIV